MVIKNVHGNTLDLLGEQIVAGRYPPGTSIPPDPMLCVELGVSRTVIREVAREFEFLRIEPRGGTPTYVAQPGGGTATAFGGSFRCRSIPPARLPWTG